MNKPSSFSRNPGGTSGIEAGPDRAGSDSILPRSQALAPGRGLGLLLLAEAALSFAPLIVLGPAIGWPASLSQPAAVQLQAIAAAPGAVAVGYGLYLLYSVLVAPALIGLAVRVFGGLQQPLAASVAAFAALSTLARAIGILRWLTVMPELAAARAAASPVAMQHLDALFEAINSLAGGIGELLGVSLFMALAMALLCAGGWQRRTLPRPLAAAGLVVAAMLAGLFAPALGIPLSVPIALAVTALTLWMVAAGAWCLWAGRAR